MKDLNRYALGLHKAMEEKLFFLDHIDLHDYEFIIDFGCGTGELLRRLKPHVDLHTQRLFGFDTNVEMIKYASQYITDPFACIDYLTDIDHVRSLIGHLEGRKLIIFSSVFHEMTPEQQKVAMDLMVLCDAVVIRDMKRPLNNEPISNVTRNRIISQVAPWQADLFESRWGKINDKEKMYRFFLMNEFVENFESEVEEDYFSVPWSEIAWALEENGFELVDGLSYTLPYRYQQVKKRFNHAMQDITHRRVVYVKSTEGRDDSCPTI